MADGLAKSKRGHVPRLEPDFNGAAFVGHHTNSESGRRDSRHSSQPGPSRLFAWRDKTALRALGVSFNTILGLTEVALAQQQATGSTPREPNPRQSERRQHYRAAMEAGVPVYLLHPKNFLEYGKQLNWDVKFTSTAVRQALSQCQIRRGMLTSMQLPNRENTCPV
ncbi:hypothetical protein LZ32DRAFT_306205 [Colletotrichum eremochloae]|nr:hypothetical protein LZ32DRAFT_306205 [Colletotrichum eremochloae]